MYVIDETKHIDSLSGGDTHIIKIDKEGFNEISTEEQENCYNKLIDDLSDIFHQEFSNIKKR